MKKIDNKELYFESFDTVREFTNTLQNGKVNDSFWFESSQDRGYSRKRFTGTESFEEAQELITCGYKEGAKGLMTGRAGVESTDQAPRPTYRRSIVGSSPIISRVIQGRPDAMRRRFKAPNVQRVINIIYDCTVHCDITTDEMIEAGKNVLAMVRAIEADGVRVNLSVSFLTKGTRKLYGFAVKVKDASSQLNPTLAAYPMVHPSFLRRHYFRWCETTPACDGDRRLSSSYGGAATFYMDDARDYMKSLGLMKDNDYYIKFTEAHSARSIEEMIHTMGIKK